MHKSGESQRNARICYLDRLEKLSENDEHQSKSLAARGFIRLLLRLRRIILQDSVFLKQTHPNHFLFRHAVFSSPAYDRYAARVLEVVNTATSPISIQLESAMPHMVTEVTNLRGTLTSDFKNLGDELKDELGDLREAVESLEARMKRGHEKQADKTKKMGALLGSLAGVVGLIAKGVFVTRLQLPEDDDTMQIDGGAPEAGINTTDDTATRPDADGIDTPQDEDLPGMHAVSNLLHLITLLIDTYAWPFPRVRAVSICKHGQSGCRSIPSCAASKGSI
jgi:hypothetical protein